MTVELKMLFVAVTITFFFVAVLKGLNYLYKKKLLKNYKQSPVHIELLKSNASHERYIAISRKSSVLNKPMRQSGDFLDFILPYINNKGNIPENQLASLECGESRYE